MIEYKVKKMALAPPTEVAEPSANFWLIFLHVFFCYGNGGGVHLIEIYNGTEDVARAKHKDKLNGLISFLCCQTCIFNIFF